MEPRDAATDILRAVEDSGNHYRDSIPMIASENILESPGEEGVQFRFTWQIC